jgi:hypothetical protein
LQQASDLANREKTVDLFDLTPFTADVDLLHSGSTRKTKELLETILRVVPNADCFRWEVRSQDEQHQFREAFEYEHQIPARCLLLTVNGIHDPLGGIEDIRARRFRFIYRETFNKSPLFQQGRSIEVFAALLYMQTLFEADLSNKEWSNQPGLNDAFVIFKRAASEATERALEQSPYLRTRLAYLLTNTVAAMPLGLYPRLFRWTGFGKFLVWLARRNFPIFSGIEDFLIELKLGHQPVLSPSSQLSRGGYRLPFVTKAWSAMADGHEAYSHFPVPLAPGQTILLASPIMQLESGDAVCPQEFVYFAVPQNEASYHIDQYLDIDLSMVVLVRGWWKKWWPFSSRHMYSIPCVVQRRRTKNLRLEGTHTLLIRANVMDLYNVFAKFPGADSQFFLVGYEQ